MDVALSLAELNAGWGDYDRALEHLAAADQLTGGALGRRFNRERESWLEHAAGFPREEGLPPPMNGGRPLTP